jgi:hypothetical protein
LADQGDACYALALAAEIAERQGQLEPAVELAGRAAEASHARGPDYGHPRALYGRLLLLAGREAEGLAVLGELRPLLLRDESAIYYVSEALEGAGRIELAVDWLTPALETALQRRSAVAADRGGRVYEQAAVIAYALAQVRHRLRRELDLPHDEDDLLADQLRDAVDELVDDDDGSYEGTMVLFWPREELQRLLQRWPDLARTYGTDWDAHRVLLERALTRLSQSGEARLAVVAGSVDGLVAHARDHGGEPADASVRQSYVDHLEEVDTPRQTWPPQRNQPCWCGSGAKYKKCCLPRSRG